MRILFHILYYKIRSFLKLTFDWNVNRMVKNAASGLVFGGFAVGAYYFSIAVTDYVLVKQHLGIFLMHRFLSMILYVFFLSINIGNIIVSYASLYRSNETLYLLTKPVKYTTLFIIKFLDTFFYSSTTLFLMALAVLAGYGTYFHLSWTFYLWALFGLFLPFMLLSAAVGVIALMLLIKLAKRIGTRLMVVTITLGYIATIYGYFKLTNPMMLVNNVMKYYPYLDRYFGFLDPPVSKYVPSHWVAEALYWSLRGSTGIAWSYSLQLVWVCFCMIVIMLLIAKYLYYETWLISMDLRVKEEAKAAKPHLFSLTSPSIGEKQTAVILKKEFLQFFRDPSQWVHLCIISLLVVIFLGSVGAIDMQLQQPFLQTISYLVLYIFNAFLLSSITLRFVYPLISVEGQSFWKIRAAPLTMGKFYRVKYTTAAIPLVIGMEILTIIAHQPLSQFALLIGFAAVSLFFVSLAFVSMNLGLGSFYSDFRESNPIKISSSQGASLTFLLGAIYLVLLVALIYYPISDYFMARMNHMPVHPGSLAVALASIAIFSLMVSYFSTRLGLRALKRDL
jgi:ABC-2 type transport system permease protein